MGILCLALAGSPRKDGNTALLAGRALEAARAENCQTEFLYLADYRYEPCRACGGCNATGKCVIKDDAGFIFERIMAADRLVLAAPIFSMGICAQAKMLIDRAQQFWATKNILGKNVITEKSRPSRKGIFISCAGTTLPGVFDGAVRVARYFFKMLEIDILSALCYPGVDNKGDILQNSAALAEVEKYGYELAKT